MYSTINNDLLYVETKVFFNDRAFCFLPVWFDFCFFFFVFLQNVQV